MIMIGPCDVPNPSPDESTERERERGGGGRERERELVLCAIECKQVPKVTLYTYNEYVEETLKNQSFLCENINTLKIGNLFCIKFDIAEHFY